jgi:hypothetical protein
MGTVAFLVPDDWHQVPGPKARHTLIKHNEGET